MRILFRSLTAFLFAVPCLAQSARDSLFMRGAALVKASNDSMALNVLPGMAKYCSGKRGQDVIGFMQTPCTDWALYLDLNRSGYALIAQAMAMPNVGTALHDTLTVTKTLHDTVSVTRTVHDTVTVTKAAIHDTIVKSVTLHDTVTVTKTLTVHDTVFVVKTDSQPQPKHIWLVSVGVDLVNLTLGQTTHARAVAIDSSSAQIPRTFVWSSSNPAVVAVDANGLVTGLAPGSAFVQAATGGFSDRQLVTVLAPKIPPPPPPPDTTHPGHPNEPAGMAQISPTLAGDVAPPSTWTPLTWVGAAITTALDTVPGYGPTSVLHINYPAGSGNGTAPGRAWTQATPIFQDWQTPIKTLYLSYWYKVSPNFPMSLNANKMMYAQVNHANSAVLMLQSTADEGTNYTAPIHPQIGLQNIKVANGVPTFSQPFPNYGVSIPRGQWFHVEGLFVANSAGQSDGSAQFFLNGALVVNVPNIAWDVSGAAGLWDTMLWDPVYNLAVPADAVGAYHRLKDLYVSGKP